MILELQGKTPQIDSSCFIAESADIIGDVTLGARSSVWFRSVLRGDVMPIVIGSDSNIQDGSIIHGTYKKCGAVIGDRVTVGHNVTLHGCHIGDECLIGMGSTVMDQAKIGRQCVVGAGSLVTENAEFEDGVLVLGRPARVKRKLSKEELAFLKESANNYIEYSQWYKKGE